MNQPPTKVTDLAYYLYNLDAKRNLTVYPYFKDYPNNHGSEADYILLGDSWDQHGAPTKRYAHKSICIQAFQTQESKRKLKIDDGVDKQTTVRTAIYQTTDIRLMYVRLGFNTDFMVLRCMVHAINAQAPVIGFLNNQEIYKATLNHSNIFQLPEASDILNVRLEFETTAMAALKKMCGYNTNNYSEVYIDYIDSIFCNCKKADDINAAKTEFVVPFMAGLCRDANQMDIDGYPDICACLGKGALLPDTECSKENPGGCTEEEQWQMDFGNEAIRFACAKKNCVGDDTGRVYQFAPNPVCQPYNICEQTITANALKYDITNLKLCCGVNECAEVSGLSPAAGTALPPATSALCPGTAPLNNASSPIERRQKATFAWIALIVLLLLLCAVFFK